MESKIRKLELIEVPMSELEQAALDDILAGWSCDSFYDGKPFACGNYEEANPCGRCGTFTCPEYKR